MIIDLDVHALDDESVADMLELAQRFDVTLGVCSLQPAARVPRQRPPSAEYCRGCNDRTYGLMGAYPGRVLGICYVNPEHEGAAYAELESRLARQPFSGLKLLPAVPCDDPRLDPLLELCTYWQVPALVHNWRKATGGGPGESDPTMVATLAARHPDATIIALRAGGDWEYGAKALRRHENVLLEIGGNQCNAGGLEILVDHVGPDRVVFGTDAPGRSFTSQLAKVLGADLPDATKEKVLYGTTSRVLAARRPPG
jgi:predicted TIM-barrel fold metal-dependent hydrolase